MRKLLQLFTLFICLAASVAAQQVSSVDGIPISSISAINGIPIANISQINGMTISGGGSSNTLTLHNTCSNGGTALTSIACTVIASAGDWVQVEVADRNCDLTGVGDATNGAYSAFYSHQSDSSDPNCTYQYYFKNSAAGSLVVTASLSVSDTWAQISVQTFTDSGGGTAPSVDTAFSGNTSSPFFQASTTGTVANANCGTARTPSANNELVIAFVSSDGTTPTHGTNFTAVSGINQTSNPETVQYWIQTTATSTNGAFVNAADDWGAGCVAIAP